MAAKFKSSEGPRFCGIEFLEGCFMRWNFVMGRKMSSIFALIYPAMSVLFLATIKNCL